MSRYIPVVHEGFRSSFWKRTESFLFAATESVVPIVATELRAATMHLPLAFVERDDVFSLVALTSFAPSNNLLVSDEGKWLGGYLPAILRAYPFKMARGQKPDELVLCFDADSNQMSDDPSDEPFFGKDGKASETIAEVMQFLAKVERSNQETLAMCSQLNERKLLTPWRLKVEGLDGQQTEIRGLYKIDEEALGALPDDDFIQLRRSDALQLAYCQLLSTQNMRVLAQLAAKQAQVVAKTETGELDLEFLNNNGTISFGPH